MADSLTVSIPYMLEDLGIQRRVLAWLDPHGDRIGSVVWPRNTPVGLCTHLTDDPNTVGDTTIEAVVFYLNELCNAGLAARNADGTYSRTNAGDQALGGVIYAEEVAAGRLIPMSDGTHLPPEMVSREEFPEEETLDEPQS